MISNGNGIDPQTLGTRRSWGCLATIVVAFLVLRVPLMYRQPGGQDEDYYAVPGWTILQAGVPRIPYLPARNRQSVFYKADEVLLALPPAYFYWQAAVYAVTGPGYGPGRLASALAGLVAVLLVYELGRCLYRSERVALVAAGLYSLARVFFFPATFARPDMLCATFCLAAIWAAWHWQRGRRPGWLAAAGAFAGLAMLTHPFALVACLQLAGWVLLSRNGWKARLRNVLLLGGVAASVFACWLPLVLFYPEHFLTQFGNNVLQRSGPGLLWRLLTPWESVPVQYRLFLEHCGLTQSLLLFGGLLLATILDCRRRDEGATTALLLAWSSVYLMVVCLGQHPAKGYWCYPGALLFLCVGRTIEAGGLWLGRDCHTGRRRLAETIGTLVLLALMAPGSGLRVWATHARLWSDQDYNAPAFAEAMLRQLPGDAEYLVDVSYVLNFYLAGRQTVLALNIETYFAAAGQRYDYLVVSRTGIEQDLPQQLAGQWVRSYGNRDDPLACYAEVYRATRQ